MKIELAWVDALLSRWGRWAIRCESGALGFASSCILGGGGGGDGDGYNSSEPLGVVDDDMVAIDAAIRALPGVNKLAVAQVYKFGAGWSDERNAKAMGISRKILTKYILEAHRRIEIDISFHRDENPFQSANRGSCLERKQPATA